MYWFDVRGVGRSFLVYGAHVFRVDWTVRFGRSVSRGSCRARESFPSSFVRCVAVVQMLRRVFDDGGSWMRFGGGGARAWESVSGPWVTLGSTSRKRLDLQS